MHSKRLKKALFISLPLMFLQPAGQAQMVFNFSGYFLEFPVFQHTRAEETGKYYFADISRLRLRPLLQFSENSFFSIEYEAAALYQSAGKESFQQSVTSGGQIADLKWTPLTSRTWNVSHFIDRLYYRHDFNFIEITAGRQRVAWGTGRVWNPTDFFNPINPAAFAKIEKDGVDAFLAKINMGNFTDLSLVYNPAEKWRVNNFGYRFRTNFSEFDVSATGGFFNQRILIGGDFAGNFFGGGIRGEGILSMAKADVHDAFVKYIAGIDYQFSPRFYALAEYHYNGEGKSDKEDYDIERLGEGKILNVGRNYLTFQGSYLLHPLVTATAGWTMNIDDMSNYINFLISCSVSDEIAISAGGQTFFGEKLSEFWYYPSGIYLKGDVFFGN